MEKIEAIVFEDTGELLHWRHIHATDLNDNRGILHWAADQHGGQAKGDQYYYLNVMFMMLIKLTRMALVYT